jgi:hypothetical protein
LPEGGYSSTWVAYTWTVPAEVLVAGPNEVRVSVAGALPVFQDWPVDWDDLQFKDMVLWQDGR